MSDFRYYEAPNVYTPKLGDPPSVFLAGGIPGVEPWHDDAIRMLSGAGLSMVVLNPRRSDFPVGDPEAGRAQVAWEHQHLSIADITLFWFAATTDAHVVQPTTLFELGAALGEGRRIVVGADLRYPRRDIVVNQLAVWREPLRDSLAAVVADVVREVVGLSAPEAPIQLSDYTDEMGG